MSRLSGWARVPAGAVRVVTLATLTAVIGAALAAVTAGSHNRAETERLETTAARVAFETLRVTDRLSCDEQPTRETLAQCSLALGAPLTSTGDLNITRDENGVALAVTLTLTSDLACQGTAPGLTELPQAAVRAVTVTATRGSRARTVSLREHLPVPGRTVALSARPGERVAVTGPDGTPVTRRANSAGCAYFPRLAVASVTGPGGQPFLLDGTTTPGGQP